VNGSADRFVVAATFVHQGRDSHYASHGFSFGGALTRHELSVVLAGPGAECSLDGLYLARTGDVVDHHTRVVHEVGLATSHQKFKGVLDGSGHGVFDGTVVVRRDAQRTEAHQENRNLLLSNEATVHTKPHLEIDADDVKCSHGATVGRLDPAQLFYLRSRGVDLGTARAALIYAFAAELTERLPNDVLRHFLDQQVLSWLPEGNLVRGLLA
jgi:Fe-S cluster assembly protein SufD